MKTYLEPVIKTLKAEMDRTKEKEMAIGIATIDGNRTHEKSSLECDRERVRVTTAEREARQGRAVHVTRH